MTTQYAYIETFGCQMNERDSEIMGQLLSDARFAPTSDLSQADVVVVNTCSIREKAEQKAFSLLGRLRRFKRDKPELVVAVAGCVAQQEGEMLRKRMPFVDLVVGTQNIYRLPELVRNVQEKGAVGVATNLSASFAIPPFLPSLEAGVRHKRFVTIMQGCNNFCAYCVVPFTRGREISRKFEDITTEIKHLSRGGIREVTLIGQNVNSYGRDLNDKAPLFAPLIKAVATIDGIERIRFTTSHPKDLSDDLIECFGTVRKLCPHIHLPVQSGANDVLRRMNRKYTIEDYIDKVARLRAVREEIAITTDIIVGFPGESVLHFQETMDLVERVRYHGAFSFKYSDRPQARSTAFPDKVSEEEKTERLAALQQRINAISFERLEEYVGSCLEVMVEGDSRNAEGQWTGRSPANHVVNFSASGSFVAGQRVAVHIKEACLNSLRGVHVDD